MEESAPKRRKTSPRLSREDDDNNKSTTPPDPPPPQSRIPIPIPRQRRPSFASPTRSSLSRSNPDILRRRSLSPSKTAADNATRDTPEVPGEGPQTQSSQEPRTFLSSQPARPRKSIFEPESAPPDATLVSPARRMPTSSRPGLGGAMASRPRRSSGKPISRPFPEKNLQPEDIDPFARRGLRRSPPTGVIPQRPPEPEPEPDAEPELPPTPTQMGLADPVVTTPPLGIHDTPSKRRWRIESPAKSSPLKQRPLRPPEFSQKTKEPPQKAMAQTACESSPHKPEKRAGPIKGPLGTHEARQILAPDPNAELKETRDALEAEIAKLEADLEFATEENERIRRVQSLRSATELSIPASRREQLLDILRRHLVPPEKESKPDAAQDWFDLAMNPTSWLSFPSLGQTQPLTSKPQEQEEADLPAPISHHPIQLTAEKELPYLQVFTPFVFSGSTYMLPRESKKDPLLRQHNIDIRSAHPAGLFTAKIEMTVDTEKLQITDLKVPCLDQAAVAELRPFINKVTSHDCNSHMKRNVSIITWAMAEWYRVAVERAKMWHVLESELGDREKLIESVAKIRTRRKKRRRKDDDDDSSQTAQDTEAVDGQNHKEMLSRGALLPHLGRTTFELPIPAAADEESSCLRIQWRMDFDWTGESQSKVGLMIGMPGRWRHRDERGSLAKASQVFEKLVQGNEGPMTAVRTVVALLAGDA